MELRLQPKIGRLAHQAAVDLSSAGWAKSSREQAPACYTSARHKPTGVRQMCHCVEAKGPHVHMLQAAEGRQTELHPLSFGHNNVP